MRRPPSTPPLRHAEELGRSKHPLADEVLSLTNLYLDVRFGHVDLDPSATKTFQQRVRALREAKLEGAEPVA